MSRLIRDTSKKLGLQPGALVYIGEQELAKTRITVIRYYGEQLEELEPQRIEETFPSRDEERTTWINIDGLHEVEVIDKIGVHFDLHPLILEDILNTEKRPEVQDHDEQLLIVLKMLSYDEGEERVEREHVSILLRENVVISFQEKTGDVFDPVRYRIRRGKGRIRKSGSDYLAYALMDAVVDNYFLVLEKIGKKIDALEEELFSNPTNDTLMRLHNLRRETALLRSYIIPLREMVFMLEKSESPVMSESIAMYLSDLKDHIHQVTDIVDTYRDMISGMLTTYITLNGNKMNEIMKVLTVIASIFIPLTFVAGVYGMNFQAMPELEWHWGYPLVLIVMVGIALVMILYYRRKQWL